MGEGTLRPEVVRPLLRGGFGQPYVWQETCPSTQELARGLPEGGVAACEEQTAGRGRRGRDVEEPARSRPPLLALASPRDARRSRLPPLTLVVAEAVAEAAWPEAAVRWPNDVVVDGRKLAGILAEVRDGEVVVGIGVNANHERGRPAGRCPRRPDLAAAPERRRRSTGRPLLADVLEAIERRLPGVRARRLLGPRARRPARPPGEPRRRRRGRSATASTAKAAWSSPASRTPPTRSSRSTSAVEERVRRVDRRRPRERVADAHPGRRRRGVPACERVAVRGALHLARPARHGRARADVDPRARAEVPERDVDGAARRRGDAGSGEGAGRRDGAGRSAGRSR